MFLARRPSPPHSSGGGNRTQGLSLRLQWEQENQNMDPAALTLLCLCSVGLCGAASATPIQDSGSGIYGRSQERVSDGVRNPEKLRENNISVQIPFSCPQTSLPELRKARGDVPDPHPDPNAEPEPASPVSDFENSYNYVLSRLAGMDQEIHKLMVGHYTVDVKLSQVIERLTTMDAKVLELEDSVREAFQHSRDNRKETGRLEGCMKGRRIGYKCYLVYNSYEHYAGASRKCSERGGRLAMPRGRKEQEALADYVRSFFHPGNWPVWLGINDLQTEGAYLYDDGTQVSYFQWRKHFLSGQPDGGRRENCVAMASDDGDWWDHYCDRAMNYLCEFDDRVAL
ncbi:C-type lectin domain family 11 member A [Takifugu flavidus]|uniref:C-type lectin domain family 11 member A n=1 Tax=Takifugu flavidus TaxID=433684 RepID=A0A5C6NMF2_9TELE|nr:C-type lectin domain family 11 member A [Takifugu flavidus]